MVEYPNGDYEEHMRRSRQILVIALLLLLQAFSFNAYACLFSIGPAAESAMPDCPSSPKDLARQICDVFKTIGVNAALELYASIDSHSPCLQDSESLAIRIAFPLLNRVFAHYPLESPPPHDVIARTAVLRI
jgi:hypothetical protein